MTIKRTKTARRSVDEIAGIIAQDNSIRSTSFVRELQSRAGRVPVTRELVLHKKYNAIHHVRSDGVEILRVHYVAQNL